MKTAFFALAAAILLAAPLPSLAADDDHIFCTFEEFSSADPERRIFYTAVFLGDYSFTIGYTNKFRDYLEAEYDFNGIDKYCFFEDTARDASRDMDNKIRDDESRDLYGGGVIRTNWSPDNFSNQPLQDFHITIDGDESELEICVRDHECEDGDKVRVSVGGSRIFSGEIDNDWDCDDFKAEAGRDYVIELFAINGTGRKGNCSHRDVNTGEVRVEGVTSKTQSWRHRGGAGSRARIVVTAK